MEKKKFVGRAGDKLDFALREFNIDVAGKTCADFGSSVGGFVDCFLQNGVKKVYAIETGYGVLDWGLRNNPKVVVMERTNAMHVELPEKVDLISIDTSWTRQKNIIPNALANLKDNGEIITLIKPHYEADKTLLRKGKLSEEGSEAIAKDVAENLKDLKVKVKGFAKSPVLGGSAKNVEYVAYLERVE